MSRLPFSTKKYIVAACLSSMSLLASEPAAPSLSTEKTLHVKRISEYWKDGDYKRAKIQIIQFLETTPDSPYHDHLYAMLGDLHFLEGTYNQAIDSYKNIKAEEMQAKIFKNFLQCHFSLKEYAIVVERVEQKNLPTLSPEVRFLYAESLYQLIVSNPDLQRDERISRAKKEYIQLENTSFKPRAAAVLAQLYKMTGDAEQAAALYDTLITLNPAQKENLLMEKASQEMQFDKSSAIKSFEEVYSLQGPLASKAAYNQMVLLFEEKNFNDLIARRTQFESLLPKEKLSLLYLLTARSYYANESYDLAVNEIGIYFSHERETKNQDRTALLTLISAAEKMQDLELYSKGMEQFHREFSGDIEYENIILVHAHLCIEKGSLEGIKNDLEVLQKDFPSSSQLEPLAFDYALLLSKNDLFHESHEAFLAFTEKFPSSSQRTTALEEATHCSLEMMKKENTIATQKVLIKDLLNLLEQGDKLEGNQREQYTTFLLQNLLEMKEYNQAITYLETYFEVYPEAATKADLLFFLAVSYFEAGHKDLFIPNGEHILKISPEFSEKDFLHKQLYNLYINKEDCYSQCKAAEHLFSCYETQPSGVSLENKIWLATHLMKIGKRDDYKPSLEKAHLILQDLLYNSDGFTLAANPALEEEVIKFIELLDLEGNNVQKLQVLEDLHSIYKQDTGVWKWKKIALLDLASTYRYMDEPEKAIDIYDELIRDPSQTFSYHTYLALLEKCKLQSKIIDPSQITEENPEISQILDDLKDLQIKKKLSSEPIHLEAALDYADIRVLLAAPEAKQKQTVFFLERIKEDFASMEATDYLLTLEQFPEQALIYHAYMDYVDMKIDYSLGNLAKEQDDAQKAAEFHTRAKDKLGKLLMQVDVLPKYLQDRLSENKQTL